MGSFLFDSSTERIAKNSPTSTDCTYLTFCAWARIADPAVTAGYIGPFYIFTTVNGAFYRTCGFSGTAISSSGLFGNGDGTTFDVFTPDITANDWFFWVMRINGTGAAAVDGRIYDATGTLVDEISGALDSSFVAPTIMVIGGTSTKAIIGNLGRVRVWASGSDSAAVLSWAQVEAEMRSTSAVITSNNILDALGDSATSPSGWTNTGVTVDSGNTPPDLSAIDPIVMTWTL